MRYFIFIIFTLFTSFAINGQTPTLQAFVNENTVSVGDHITLTYEFNYSGTDFTPPANLTQNFRLLGGPNQSMEMRSINGVMRSKLSYSYVIGPLNPGNYTINPASITFENKVYSSQQIRIKVIKNNESNTSSTKKENKAAQREKTLKENIYIRLHIDKKTAYQGEQIIATYKLYNKLNLMGIEAQRMPEFNGFYTKNIDLENSKQTTREVINGVLMQVYILQKTILIPQKSGELTLIPLEIDAVVGVQSTQSINTIFGRRFQSEEVRLLLKSNPIKIHVKPLPKGAPDSFNGAVGKFKFTTTIAPHQVEVNDALNYVIKISGTGNIPLIDNPVPEWPQEFEVYDPKLKSNIKISTQGISGSKTWDYLMIPRNGGDYTFKGLYFTYFNPETGKYHTIKEEKVDVHIQGSNADQQNNTPSINKQELSRMGTDIRFIHTSPTSLNSPDSIFFRSIWFYILIALPLVLSGLIPMVMAKRTELKSDTVGHKRKKATKLAKAKLKYAHKLLQSDTPNEFYDAVSKALYGYISNKFNLSRIDLDEHRIKSILDKASVNESTQALLFSIINHCDMARFAPISTLSDSDILSQAEQVIITLEDELK